MRGIRVIAGSARGRRLVVPAGESVRPTKDIVREAVFSALDARGRIVDAVVLDLFAGTGALAIEALSRGAARATLVERDRHALAAIETNLETLEFTDRARVIRGDVESVLLRTPPPAAFDLVFVDPPYDAAADHEAAVVDALAEGGWLAPDALVSVEGPLKPRSDPPDHVRVEWERSFGDTLVRFLVLV